MVKKWLYYTGINGDVSCLPYTKNLEASKKLAPEGAIRFQIIDGKDLPDNPIWKDGKYISDSLKLIREAKNQTIDLSNKIEEVFYVQANGRVYDFSNKNMLKFFAEFSMQGNDEVLNWDDNDNESHDHTKVESFNIVNAAKTFLRSLHNAKKADKAACVNEDFSLSNLKAIEAAQEDLKGQ